MGGTDNHVRAFALPEGKPLWDVEAHSDWVMSLAFSHDGKTLASGSRDRTARLFDATHGEIKATYTNHETAVLAVCFTADDQGVISGSADGELRRWDLEARSDKSTTTRPGHAAVLGIVQGLGRTFVTLADQGLIEEDMKAKKVVRKFAGHTAQVDAMALIAEPPTLVSASHDGEVRLWDLKENRERGKFVAVP